MSVVEHTALDECGRLSWMMTTMAGILTMLVEGVRALVPFICQWWQAMMV